MSESKRVPLNAAATAAALRSLSFDAMFDAGLVSWEGDILVQSY